MSVPFSALSLADAWRWPGALVRVLSSVGQWIVAAAVEGATRWDTVAAGWWVASLAGISIALAHLYQRQLNGAVRASPGASASWWKHELLAHVVLGPPTAFVLGVRAAWEALRRGLRRLRAAAGGAKGGTPAGDKPAPTPGLLVASIGPSLLDAAVITLGLWAACLLGEPLLAARLGLSEGLDAWEYLVFGRAVAFESLLPLSQRPYLAGVVITVFWMTVWWTVARLVRRLSWGHLGGNLDAQRGTGLWARWRDWYAVPQLHAPSTPFLRWAKWLAFIFPAGLVFAWPSVGAETYRLPPSLFAMGVVCWLAWTLHLRLRGLDEPVAPEAAEPEARTAASLPDWESVVAELKATVHLAPPVERAPRREVSIPPAPVRASALGSTGCNSTLVGELLPAPDGAAPALRHGQFDILKRLGEDGQVVLAPVAKSLEMSLEEDASRVGGRAAERHHLVLAPEGYGKTTLARLAVVDAVLSRSATALVVCRDADAARGFFEPLQRAVRQSSMRWNVRCRLAGPGLADELARRSVPDVIVASLEDLVVSLLALEGHFDVFLQRLRLVVVDDVEAFHGPVEVHAQLAFRRLLRRLEALPGRAVAGDLPAQVLALGCETMDGVEKWAESLLGVDLALRRFEALTPSSGESAAGKAPHLRLLSLSDLRTRMGGPVTLSQLIDACERTATPWHFRAAGDGHRPVGLGRLALDQAVNHHVDDSADAAVIVASGVYADVQREVERLSCAGWRYLGVGEPRTQAGAGAIVTDVEAVEETALAQLEKASELARLVRALPRAIVRAPDVTTTAAHAASELVGRWMETAAVLDTFTPRFADTLQRLAADGHLVADEYFELPPGHLERGRRVRVQVLAQAVGGAPATDAPSVASLPPKVGQVEAAANEFADLVDVASGRHLRRIDRATAAYVYYPRRVLAEARGRYVVRAASPGSATVEAEPYLGTEQSVPRRRTSVALRGEQPSDSASVATEVVPRVEPPSHGPPPPATGRRRTLVLGQRPVEVVAGRVSCRSWHLGTCLVGRAQGDLRAVHVTAEDERKPVEFDTEGLLLFPNPAGDKSARLTFGQARLLVAAMRLVLPSLFRGGADVMDVCVGPQRDGVHTMAHELGPDDAIAFFDVQRDGNGATRALERDSLELLLRLARAAVERVLKPAPLLNLYDTWGDEEELKRMRPSGTGQKGEAPAPAPAPAGGVLAEPAVHAIQAADRVQLLEWLDAHLRPEGTPAGASAALLKGVGAEDGEGDEADLGRVWYSAARGGPVHLVWTRHRWRVEEQREALLDVGLDRQVVHADEVPRPIEAPGVLEVHLTAQQGGAADQAAWGAAADSYGRTVADEALVALHARLCEWALESLPTVGNLVARLDSHFGEALGGGIRRCDRQLVHLVQAIPTTRRVTTTALRPPAWTLAYREGDELSKALLLAVLLRRGSGPRCHVFVSTKEQRAALAWPVGEVQLRVEGDVLPPPSSAPPSPPTQRQANLSSKVQAVVGNWARSRGEERPVRVFGWDEEPGAAHGTAYVPWSVSGYDEPGVLHVDEPEAWYLLPLTAAWQAKPEGNA